MPNIPLRYKAKRPYAKAFAVIVAIALIFLLLPLPLPFNATLQTTGLGPSRVRISTMDCLWLSGTWSTVGKGSDILNIVAGDGSVVYNDTLGFGTFSFYAPDAPYTAVVYSSSSVTVQIGGTAWGPLIPIGLP